MKVQYVRVKRKRAHPWGAPVLIVKLLDLTFTILIFSPTYWVAADPMASGGQVW